MTDRGKVWRSRVRSVLFAIFAVCTLWLIVQNLVLFTLVPWHELLARLPGSLVCVSFLRGWVPALGLVPVAFALGWVVAARPGRSVQRRPS